MPLRSFAARIDPLPHPRIAVLLGGESQAFSFPPELAASSARRSLQAARDSGGSLLVTPSRRTSPEALRALAATIAGVPHFVWDGSRGESLLRLPRRRRRHRRDRGLGQHGHRGGRHRQAGLCAAAQGQLKAPRPVPRTDAGARRDPTLRRARSNPGPTRRSTTPSWSQAPSAAPLALKALGKPAEAEPAGCEKRP